MSRRCGNAMELIVGQLMGPYRFRLITWWWSDLASIIKLEKSVACYNTCMYASLIEA